MRRVRGFGPGRGGIVAGWGVTVRTYHQRLAEALADTEAMPYPAQEIERALLNHWPTEDGLRRRMCRWDAGQGG